MFVCFPSLQDTFIYSCLLRDKSRADFVGFFYFIEMELKKKKYVQMFLKTILGEWCYN